jgi:hypothetical protein
VSPVSGAKKWRQWPSWEGGKAEKRKWFAGGGKDNDKKRPASNILCHKTETKFS